MGTAPWTQPTVRSRPARVGFAAGSSSDALADDSHLRLECADRLFECVQTVMDRTGEVEVGEDAVQDIEAPANAVDAQRSEQHRRLGRAYRAGRLVCGCVHVAVSLDGRLGLAPHERRLVRVCFHEPLDDDLRSELTQLVRRRGAAARRAVELLDPIELVVDDPHGARQRIIGHLQPPQMRHGQLRDIEFELKRAR